jgi:hypothetical protein
LDKKHVASFSAEVLLNEVFWVTTFREGFAFQVWFCILPVFLPLVLTPMEMILYLTILSWEASLKVPAVLPSFHKSDYRFYLIAFIFQQ